VGDGAVVGANAVVLNDVAPGALAVGVPARVVERDARSIATVTGGHQDGAGWMSPRGSGSTSA
jgi:serine acetyltransferase